MKKILIVEDNKVHMDAIVKIISEIGDVEIFRAYNMLEACYMLSLNSYNLFLVDIILDTGKQGDVSGLDFVRMVRDNKRYQFTPVVFITSLEDPMLSAFKELHCYDFIEKPYDEKVVLRVVREALEYPITSKEEYSVFFRKDGVLYSVKLGDIKYVRIVRGGVTVYTIDDFLELPYRPVVEVLKDLDQESFIQCNRNTIINKNFIESIDFLNKYIRLIGIKEPIEIGITMRKKLEKELKV